MEEIVIFELTLTGSSQPAKVDFVDLRQVICCDASMVLLHWAQEARLLDSIYSPVHSLLHNKSTHHSKNELIFH